ncbi:MAG: ATP-binding protein [Thermoanaerobaculia bacterium]|nr:ATP-binding protein [Thermoanaerobaculia bacterium]
MTPGSGPWEREVRRFVVSGLVFVLFLSIASLAALRMTTRWAVTQMESRLAAEARAVATGVEASGDLVSGLTTDAGVVRLVKEFAPLQVALFDGRGVLRRSVTWLPDAARVPDRLPDEERPVGPEVRVVRAEEAGVPIVVAAVPLVASRSILRVLYDATPIVAAERMLRILAVVVPAGMALLVVLAVPFLRRFTRPIDALAETARSADALVPPGPPAGAEPIAAVAAFRRTIEELRARTAELEVLRQSEQRRADALAVTSETLIRSHPGGLLVLGPGGELAEANPPALAALGLGRDALGAPAGTRLADWPVLARAVEAALRGEPTLGADAAGGDATGARLLAVTAVPVADRDGRFLGALVFLEDRTAVKRLERELSFRRELAALGEMSAGIAHEFRNATAAILGYVRLAQGASDAEARTRHLARIRAEAEHVARVTGDFLLFARPERLQLAPVALTPLVEEVLSEGRATSPGASFEAEGAFPEVEADAALLRRALVNLVRNAAEAAGEGGRVVVRGEPADGGGIVLVVEDTGPGVAPDAAEKLFVPFASTKEGGTGLGLSLVAKIAALHGGSVGASRSAALGGAAFRLVLPPPARR